jgi:hypothetical protein
MTLYQGAIAVHVLTAVLGVGQIVALTRLASSGGDHPPWVAMQRLAAGGTWSLLLMLATGALLEYAVGGGYHNSWWFRISVLLFFTLGGVLGWTRRRLRAAAGSGDATALVGVGRAAWTMCAIIGSIAFLMQIKPW